MVKYVPSYLECVASLKLTHELCIKKRNYVEQIKHKKYNTVQNKM